MKVLQVASLFLHGLCHSSPVCTEYRGEVSALFCTSILFIVLDSVAIIVHRNPAAVVLFGSMSVTLDLTPYRLPALC